MSSVSILPPRNPGKIVLVIIMSLTAILVLMYWLVIQSLQIKGLPLYFMQLGLYLVYYLLTVWGLKQEQISLSLNARRIAEAMAWSLGGWLFFLLMIQLLGLAQLSEEFRALRNSESWKIGLKVLSTWFFVGMGEELLFRGYFLKAFWRHFTSGLERGRMVNTILLVSVFFSLWHLPIRIIWLLSGELDLVSLIISQGVLFLLGLAFTYLFVRSENILLTGLVHGLVDYPLVGVNSQMTWLILLAIIGSMEITRWATRKWRSNTPVKEKSRGTEATL